MYDITIKLLHVILYYKINDQEIKTRTNIILCSRIQYIVGEKSVEHALISVIIPLINVQGG